MKKYVKPDLYYENFELSTHVAACAWDMGNLQSKDTCSAQADNEYLGFGDVSLFNNEKCDIGDADYEDYCWTNGSVGANVFNS